MNERVTALDVLGIGLAVDLFDLDGIAGYITQNPSTPMMPADINLPVPPESERLATSDKQFAGCLANAVSGFIRDWPIPGVSAWPSLGETEPSKTQKRREDELAFFFNRLNTLLKLEGKCKQSFSPVGAVFANESEEILERAFQFFEQNPTVPALLVFANEGMLARKAVNNQDFVPYQADRPRRLDSIIDSAGAILLARREAINLMRQFLGARATHLYEAGAPKTGFTPSPFVPNIWTHEQIDHFDQLPTLCRLYRPKRIPLRADMNSRQRQAAFNAGLQEALSLLNGKAPSRIFHDSGPYGLSPNGALLGSAIFDFLPDFDLDSPQFSFDMFSRIGNLGAVSPYAQWVLATTASSANKDASLTINLRKHDEATITVVAA
jgi:hypothetical protein